MQSPRRALIVSDPAVPVELASAVEKRLLEQWPSMSLSRLGDPAEEGDARFQDLDIAVLLRSGADGDWPRWAEEALSRLPARTRILVARPDGELWLLRAESAADASPESIADGVARMVERSLTRRATVRRLRYRIERLRRTCRRLNRLSLQDPLTRVLNRRGFRRFFRAEWSRAARQDGDVACVMIDIDRFKRLNDSYGHKVGDQILRRVAGILRQSCRASDILGRVGGEEFCVILPSCNEHQAFLWAEKVRRRIAGALLKAGGKSLRITASFGVAASHGGLVEEQDLIDTADRAMLAAKQGGRNRTVPASDLNGRLEASQRIAPGSRVVRVLLDSLALRDAATYKHSHRVAQLATLLAKQVGLGENELWIAEVAGLLHDIGKIGLPDSVLQKADRLTPEERRQVDLALKSSSDVVRSAFGDGPLAEAVESSRVWVKDAGREGRRLPISARIVAIADAFDSMTSPWAYRPALSRSAAIAELARNAGTQFDADLVREFRAIAEDEY